MFDCYFAQIQEPKHPFQLFATFVRKLYDDIYCTLYKFTEYYHVAIFVQTIFKISFILSDKSCHIAKNLSYRWKATQICPFLSKRAKLCNLIEIEFSIEFKIVPCLKWLLKTEKMLYADYADSISSVVL